jgi:hypothetical protein
MHHYTIYLLLLTVHFLVQVVFKRVDACTQPLWFFLSLEWYFLNRVVLSTNISFLTLLTTVFLFNRVETLEHILVIMILAGYWMCGWSWLRRSCAILFLNWLLICFFINEVILLSKGHIQLHVRVHVLFALFILELVIPNLKFNKGG